MTACSSMATKPSRRSRPPGPMSDGSQPRARLYRLCRRTGGRARAAGEPQERTRSSSQAAGAMRACRFSRRARAAGWAARALLAHSGRPWRRARAPSTRFADRRRERHRRTRAARLPRSPRRRRRLGQPSRLQHRRSTSRGPACPPCSCRSSRARKAEQRLRAECFARAGPRERRCARRSFPDRGSPRRSQAALARPRRPAIAARPRRHRGEPGERSTRSRRHRAGRRGGLGTLSTRRSTLWRPGTAASTVSGGATTTPLRPTPALDRLLALVRAARHPRGARRRSGAVPARPSRERLARGAARRSARARLSHIATMHPPGAKKQELGFRPLAA